MIVGNCVACDGLVRIPLNANPDAIVRCPRCGDNFRLGSVLQNAAPALEVVDADPKPPEVRSPRVIPILDDVPQQPSDRQRGDKFAVSPILQKGAERKKKRRRRRSSSSSSPSTNGVETVDKSHPVSVDLGEKIAAAAKQRKFSDDAPSRTSRPKPRTSSSKSSSSQGSGMELSKIILGACLALPVAQLLIWWFAGTDPLNLGPKVGRILPFVVPAEFQPASQDEDDLFDDDVSAFTADPTSLKNV